MQAPSHGVVLNTLMTQRFERGELKLFGYINLSRYFYRHMKERQSGVIMNVVLGGSQQSNLSLYCRNNG